MYNENSEKMKKSQSYEEQQQQSQYSHSHSHSISDFRQFTSPKDRVLYEENQEDEQIAKIVRKVMGKSRRSYLEHSRQVQYPEGNYKTSDKEPNILEVNFRIEQENIHLREEIQKLQNKMKKLTKMSVNKSHKNISMNSQSSINGQNQLKKLKVRLEKASAIHEKMQSELKFLQKSRNSQAAKKKKIKSSQFCLNCSQQKQKITERNHKKFIQQNTETLFSPITELQQYNIPQIETSTFKINPTSCQEYGSSQSQTLKIPIRKISVGIQASQYQEQITQQNNQIDEEILALQTKIINNNQIIDNFQRILLRKLIN